MVEIEIPQLTFNMLGVDGAAVRLVAREMQRFFGEENYEEFKRANKKGEDIPVETKQRVNGEIYEKVGKDMFKVRGGLRVWEKFWDDSIVDAIRTHNYTRNILFPEQDRRATLTTNIAWSDRRPSSILKILTMPTKQMGEQCKYEQGLILGIGLLCAEVRSKDEDGVEREVLREVNDFLESKLFTGKKGDPKQHSVYSYHIPGTDKLEGLSHEYPDPQFGEELWVKLLEYPVRFVGDVPVLYDTREKDTASLVVKIMQRSRKTAKAQANGNIIETTPYTEDAVGFRLVNMQGGRPFRDLLTGRLEELLPTFEGFDGIKEDNRVDLNQGKPDRVVFQRRKIKVKRLKTPIEMIVESLEDYIAEQYEVGSFSEKLGMHDGPAHPLYKLKIAADVADCIWPPKLTGIDHAMGKKTASYAYAFNLGRKQRIYPSPFAD